MIMPELGCDFSRVTEIGGTVEVSLRSNWPGHAGFERSDDDGATWDACGTLDYLMAGAGTVRYRSVDGETFAGKHAVIDV